MKNSFFFLVIMVGLAACAPKPSPESKTTPYVLLSKELAKKWVVTDEKEKYFDKVANLEMSIQMKKNLEEAPRDKVLADYKKMLQEDLMDFTAKETAVMTTILDKAMKMCYKIKKDIKLPQIQIIKTKGKYYGSSVFYTRDNSIIIPEPMIPESAEDATGFLSTMLHEIFHVYSRYNKDKRDALYARIGFEKLPNLKLSDFLKKRVLYNPDGVDLRYAITLKDKEGKPFKAVPVIYSQYKEYTPQLNTFFGYLIFQVFEAKEENGQWKIINKNIGYSLDEISGFWEQVTENTRYNIHPDELCADNFVILAKSKLKNSTVLDDLAPEGKKLVEDFEAILLK